MGNGNERNRNNKCIVRCIHIVKIYIRCLCFFLANSFLLLKDILIEFQKTLQGLSGFFTRPHTRSLRDFYKEKISNMDIVFALSAVNVMCDCASPRIRKY